MNKEALDILEASAAQAADWQWPSAEQFAELVNSSQMAELLAAATPTMILALIRDLRASQAATTSAGLAKVCCAEDDMLLFRIPHDRAPEIARALKHAIPPGIRALAVTDEVEIATIDEEFMRANGWVKA